MWERVRTSPDVGGVGWRRGVPKLGNKDARGNHFVTVKVEIPTKVSSSDKEMLEKLRVTPPAFLSRSRPQPTLYHVGHHPPSTILLPCCVSLQRLPLVPRALASVERHQGISQVWDRADADGDAASGRRELRCLDPERGSSESECEPRE